MKNYNNEVKLDFKTKLFLYITKAIKKDYIPIEQTIEKKPIYVQDTNPHEVYIFPNHDEYRKFFLMYLNEVDNDLIDLAIYTKGSKGQIVALKGLCERIIVKKKVNDFYRSITKEQINEIHSKGKLTPLEIVQQWENLDLCVKGNKTNSSTNRCKYFDYNCHECLMETASHQLEHDKIDFQLFNLLNDEKPVKKLIANNK